MNEIFKVIEPVFKKIYKIKLFKKIIQFLMIKLRVIFWKYRSGNFPLSKNELFFFEYLKKKLKNNKFKLLELGCSEGNLLNLLKNKFPLSEITGYDINIECIKKASIEKKNINFEIKNFTEIEIFKDFDYIISKASLIYLNEKEIDEILYKIIKSKFKKCFLMELATNSNNAVKVHFFAHNYNLILKRLSKNKNIIYKIHSIGSKINWYSDNKKIFPIILEIYKH